MYIPGGRAAYPSTVLMTAIPARVAGVREIVLVTPPSADGRVEPAVLAAARLAGVTEAYRVGGAQAIAALAYGTATIRRVDKIVGPGNVYVALAKSRVFGDVGIDMVAGPSEVVVVADGAADPEWIAADLLAQAEHDPMARAVLVTDAEALVPRVERALTRQLAALPRRAIAGEALARHGALVVVDKLEDAVELANRLAPEHLELLVARAASAAAARAPRGRRLHRQPDAGSRRRLRRGAEPRAADGRHRALLVAARYRGLRQAHERDRVLGAGPDGGAGPPCRAHGGGRARRPRPGGRGAIEHEGRRGGRMSLDLVPRQAHIERKTKETDIVLHLNIDGTGASKIQTGIPFFSHMLEAWSKHGLDGPHGGRPR